MQFNSFIFILLFLPLTVLIYHLSNKLNYIAGKIVLIIASLIFYAYSDWSALIFIGLSLALNYLSVRMMLFEREIKRTPLVSLACFL